MYGQCNPKHHDNCLWHVCFSGFPSTWSPIESCKATAEGEYLRITFIKSKKQRTSATHSAGEPCSDVSYTIIVKKSRLNYKCVAAAKEVIIGISSRHYGYSTDGYWYASFRSFRNVPCAYILWAAFVCFLKGGIQPLPSQPMRPSGNIPPMVPDGGTTKDCSASVLFCLRGSLHKNNSILIILNVLNTLLIPEANHICPLTVHILSYYWSKVPPIVSYCFLCPRRME